MAITIALDELLSTGWSGLDTTGCSYDDTGRAFPSVQRIHQEFASSGFDLTIAHIPAFNCYRAQWCEAGATTIAGSTVSNSQEEAAIHVLAQLRRSLATA